MFNHADSTTKKRAITAVVDGDTSLRVYPILHNPHDTLYSNMSASQMEDTLACIADAQACGISIPADVTTACMLDY